MNGGNEASIRSPFKDPDIVDMGDNVASSLRVSSLFFRVFGMLNEELAAMYKLAGLLRELSGLSPASHVAALLMRGDGL